jgi:hypothetical protein
MIDNHKDICEELFNAANTLLKRDGFINSRFLVIKDKQVTILILPEKLQTIEDQDHRKRTEFLMAKDMCNNMKGEALLHVSEAWSVVGSKEELLNYKGTPSDHPNRKETLNITYIGNDGEKNLLVGDIIKLSDTDQKIIISPEWVNLVSLSLFDEREGQTLH